MVIPTAYVATLTEFRQPNITTLKPISQSGSELVQSPKWQRVAAENCERKHAQVLKENKRTDSKKKKKSLNQSSLIFLHRKTKSRSSSSTSRSGTRDFSRHKVFSKDLPNFALCRDGRVGPPRPAQSAWPRDCLAP